MGSLRRRVPHVFAEDPDLAERWVSAERRLAGLGPRRWCAKCGLPGEPGDGRHWAPEAEARRALVLAEAAALAERILGEHDREPIGAGR